MKLTIEIIGPNVNDLFNILNKNDAPAISSAYRRRPMRDASSLVWEPLLGSHTGDASIPVANPGAHEGLPAEWFGEGVNSP